MDEKDKSNIYVDQYGKRIKRKITQKQKILSDTEIACVVTEYQNGASTYDLACKYGCHRNTIICHLRKNGFKVSNGKINSEQSAEIAELYKSGVSSITIAKRLSISQSTVLNHLHLQGVEVRKGRPCHTTI